MATTARSNGVLAVLVGSGLSGLGAYGFQVLGTQALGAEGYAPVGVLWTLQFLLFSVVLYPVETWVTRLRVTSDHPGGAGPPRGRAVGPRGREGVARGWAPGAHAAQLPPPTP